MSFLIQSFSLLDFVVIVLPFITIGISIRIGQILIKSTEYIDSLFVIPLLAIPMFFSWFGITLPFLYFQARLDGIFASFELFLAIADINGGLRFTELLATGILTLIFFIAIAFFSEFKASSYDTTPRRTIGLLPFSIAILSVICLVVLYNAYDRDLSYLLFGVPNASDCLQNLKDTNLSLNTIDNSQCLPRFSLAMNRISQVVVLKFGTMLFVIAALANIVYVIHSLYQSNKLKRNQSKESEDDVFLPEFIDEAEEDSTLELDDYDKM